MHMPRMTVKVAILGASGYVGAELLRLCARHPDLAPVALYAQSSAGQSVGALYPHLAPAYADAVFAPLDALALDGVDLVLAALPHGESQAMADQVIASDAAFVDLGADFRLKDAAAYRQWYGEDHAAPGLLGRFVYGLPELHRAGIAASRLVAAPGCYPTAAILALKPLVDAGLVEAEGLIVDAASGVSGAGRAAKVETGFCTVDESFAAYGLLSHRHTAEMNQALGGEVLFTPHLAPMSRGILATCYATPTREMQRDTPLQALHAAYADEPFVTVVDGPPATKWAQGSNSAFVTAAYDARTRRVVAVCAIDNLVKGAAGQMIQCANLMLGLPETAGLPLCGVFP
jgi:N-acetyl-gamma-glutamyl-phosphate reductase